jgi:methyl-accepting chemotaxis protein
MGEISEASSQQSAGVSQVGQAITQMDQATQQNAALVEHSAAAAESLRAQAHQLVQLVAVFKLGHAGGTSVRRKMSGPVTVHDVVPAPTRLTKPPAPTYPVIERRSASRVPGETGRISTHQQAVAASPSAPGKPASAPRSAPAGPRGDEGDWETF